MVRRKNASPLCGFATDERRKNRLVILSEVEGSKVKSLVSRLSSLV
ncbi:MAG: hypothetical protein II835_06095 [Fibrobacter sp.]|jgi:hypothetical protein|nr:hypothetical protein [Fibrobacter sp.]